MKNKKIYIIIIILVLIVISGGLFVLFNNKNAQKFEITGILELHDEKGYGQTPCGFTGVMDYYNINIPSNKCDLYKSFENTNVKVTGTLKISNTGKQPEYSQILENIDIYTIYPTNIQSITLSIGGKTETETLVSVCDLENNPALYINKIIQIEAIAKFVGESYWAQKGDFFLEDTNCQIRIFSWAPTTVAQCPPTVKNCNAPATMFSYLDKKVRLSGILKELPKEEYINQKWITTGIYYAITDIKNASIISNP